ncbi:MAG: PSD1 and planctomycete cytochrome C domain-containing protein [Bryobacteraceae bacterium]
MRTTWVMLLAAPLAAAPNTEFFESQVRPIFANHCYACHSSKTKTPFAGLRLDSKSAAFKGSDAGPVIVPGRGTESRLILALRGKLAQPMPPAGRLKDDQIDAIEKWINDGAAWPGDASLAPAAPTAFNLRQRRDEHWAWRLVHKPHASGIDHFVAARLSAAKLSPAPPAARAVLIRRLTFDLTGLPPSPSDVQAFEQDRSPEANAKLIDRLLESPRFGEHWARHWMDLVRYSESHGSEGDPDTREAWRYRDYLIRAFNQDVPYRQLLREHLAGDLLPNPRIDKAAGVNESVIGTAHFRMVEHGFQPVDPWEDRIKWTDNQIDVFSKAFQGLTLSCARCHDHKFDAISQRDFYAVFSIIGGARPTQRSCEAPERLDRNTNELARLKQEIRKALAEAWLAALLSQAVTVAAVDGTRFANRWDLAGDEYLRWVRHGKGAPAKPSPPGEFSIEPSGDRIVTAIYPAGVYSHLRSRRDAAVIQSPRFKVDTDAISLRVAGGNFSSAQLIIENYAVPRGGIYKQRYAPKRDKMGWFTWDTTFWRGFTAYIELSTLDTETQFSLDEEQARMRPQPKPVRDGRSWFGISAVAFHDGKDFTPRDSVAPAPVTLREAVEAWRDGRMSGEQAAVLDEAVRNNLLPTSMESLPSVAPLVEQWRKLDNAIPVSRMVPSVLDEAGEPARLLVRGNHKMFGPPVPHRYLEALDSQDYPAASARLLLADAVASANNPLTARVFVNRLWRYMMGRGIVRSVDNFGKLGDKPTHPELLDWLAAQLVEDGWSVKKTLRRIALSAAYQRGGDTPAATREADPANDLFHSMPPRRLEAEALRDSILAVAGQLDLTMGGPSVDVYYAHDTGKTKGDKPKGPLDGNGRRSVYLEIRRNVTNPFLDVFDFPKPSSTRGQRDVTTVPAQSLAMMNSPFVIDQAEKWARSALEDGATAPAQRAGAMFQRALGRAPSPRELDRSLTFLADLATEHGATPALMTDFRVWRDFAQSIFNLEEFLYVR